MEPRFLPPNSGDLVTVMGIRHRVLVTADQSGGAFPGELRGAKDPAAIAATASRYGISFVS